MKTIKYSYRVENIVTKNGGVGFEKVVDFPTLSMARQYCTFNRGHYRIICIGFLEYNNGVEKK